MKRELRVVLVMAALSACAGDAGDGTSADASTTSTGGGDGSSSSGASMSSTTGPDCGAPADCATCWECAQLGACQNTYDACASNFECAGSLACVDYMCTANGFAQECLDHCCQNCAEHFTCPAVDAVITCVEQLCGPLCTPASCG